MLHLLNFFSFHHFLRYSHRLSHRLLIS
jgi:hypothetical protein